MTSIRLSLDVISLRSDPDSLLAVQCANCHDSLVVHQPDEAYPDRLLATCLECGAWFLIYADKSVMVRLPDERALRKP